MTCREKLAMERPEEFKKFANGCCKGCPSGYGYLPDPPNCVDDWDWNCNDCWDREIPEETPKDTVTIELHDIMPAAMLEKMGLSTSAIAEINDKACSIKDSGNRREFETGAVRDIQEGKGRCDLMPLDVVSSLTRTLLGEHDECSSAIFMDINDFQNGGDVECLQRALITFLGSNVSWHNYNTMLLEVAKHFEEGAKKYGEYNWQKGIPVHCYIDSAVRHYLKYLRGDKDEPHDRAFVWNIMCCIWTCKHKPELNDYAKKEEENDG